MSNTILQVEDDPNDVFFLQHSMKSAGITNPIQIASDGQQAIRRLPYFHRRKTIVNAGRP